MNMNPRNGNPYFNTSLFSLPQLGSVGNYGRRFLSGPGIDNYDLTLQKSWEITARRPSSCARRLLTYSTRRSFMALASLDANITSPTFGHVVSAAPPRLLQIALKMVS
jgi:hypothetical protein